MRLLQVRNVCCALPAGLALLQRLGVRQESRGGMVIAMPYPVTTRTDKPCERVLFSRLRNANPFFHAFEAIWMLAGRNDAAALNLFVKDFGSRFAESDGTIHGAYGHRWRNAFGLDQLDYVVDKLRRDRNTRQCVIQMWDCYGHSDLDGTWKDIPCNTHIYLRLRDGHLDLTVCCRSNDAIWGAHGANAVHFSVLQEYLAARIGVQVGVMYQISNNYHAYETELQKYPVTDELMDNRYTAVQTMPMFDKPGAIDTDIQIFMDCFDKREFDQRLYVNPWFSEVLGCMMSAHYSYRSGDKTQALRHAHQIKAADWRMACVEWLERKNAK